MRCFSCRIMRNQCCCMETEERLVAFYQGAPDRQAAAIHLRGRVDSPLYFGNLNRLLWQQMPIQTGKSPSCPILRHVCRSGSSRRLS